ncbi:hypothetical protein GAGA_2989 [Paraglaciecola agarilytica NO2]|jgi:hypothetical protein|uniref:Uncharacterized protein n=1 Tax=Paraglaciecola agarilytica NO2 TaxID=1125747 RepID=A0ABQ0I900_9ALTE|nr:hypothetical protein GAGA_2989 [Paraglaciecola agarilytica NO2]
MSKAGINGIDLYRLKITWSVLGAIMRQIVGCFRYSSTIFSLNLRVEMVGMKEYPY